MFLAQKRAKTTPLKSGCKQAPKKCKQKNTDVIETFIEASTKFEYPSTNWKAKIKKSFTLCSNW